MAGAALTTMAIVAHPDDEVLGMGGTLAQIQDPYIFVACVPMVGRQTIYQANEAREVLGGVRVTSPFFADQMLDTTPIASIAAFIHKLIVERDVDTVYTHFGGDLNADHRIISEAVNVACRPYVSPVKRIYQFEVPSNTEYGEAFKPTVFQEVSDEAMNIKCQAMEVYDTEVPPYPHPRHPNSLRYRARYWGQQVGYTYAEPFILVREIR